MKSVINNFSSWLVFSYKIRQWRNQSQFYFNSFNFDYQLYILSISRRIILNFKQVPWLWMAHNGPAIWGVCVTWRSTGQCPGTLGRKLSRRAPRERSEQRGCKEGMARFLPSRHKLKLSITSVAVQSRLRAGFLSPCRMPILGTRAVSRYKFISEPELSHGVES
jgi:hypothetical protein